MNVCSFREYKEGAELLHRHDPFLRKGQAYFNHLAEVRPDLSERVRGTNLDPFNRDERLNAFLEFVSSNW